MPKANDVVAELKQRYDAARVERPDVYEWRNDADGKVYALVKDVSDEEWNTFLGTLSDDDRAKAVRFIAMNNHPYFRSRYMQIRG